MYFYNPWHLLVELMRKTKVAEKPAGAQLFGMLGVTQNLRRTLGWAVRLMVMKIRREAEPPRSTIPLESVGETCSIHTTPTVVITVDQAPAKRVTAVAE